MFIMTLQQACTIFALYHSVFSKAQLCFTSGKTYSFDLDFYNKKIFMPSREMEIP